MFDCACQSDCGVEAAAAASAAPHPNTHVPPTVVPDIILAVPFFCYVNSLSPDGPWTSTLIQDEDAQSGMTTEYDNATMHRLTQKGV